jgi:hypothetical protein
VLYERSHFGPIARLTSRTLSPGGIALFTDPHRSTQPEFIAIARQTGFNVTVEEIPGVMGSSVSLVTLRHVAG